MKRTSVMTLSLLVIVALAGMSLAYTWWTQNLTINGSVDTGKFELKFLGVTSHDPSGSNDNTNDPLNAATCNVSQGDDTSFTVTVSDAYPGYKCEVEFEISNTGTVPAELGSLVTDDGSGGSLPDWLSVALSPNNTVCSTTGVQLAAGSTESDCMLSIYVDPGKTVPEDTQSAQSVKVTYTFKQPNQP